MPVFPLSSVGEISQVIDNECEVTVRSEYDLSGRPAKKAITKAGEAAGSTEHVYTGEVKYDELGNVSKFKEKIGADREEHTTSFEYDEENKPVQLTYDGNTPVSYEYDALGRLDKRIAGSGDNGITTEYKYLAGNEQNKTTALISEIHQPRFPFAYTYDANGNITSVECNSETVSYEYDAINQLTRVNDPGDPTASENGTTWLYTYDLGGNILTKTAYAYTENTPQAADARLAYSFSYDETWRDKLTEVQIGENTQSFTYDAIGNPTSDDIWSYTWAKGRQLQCMSKPGETVSFVYNEDGLRVEKIATSTGHTKYTLHGKQIVHLTNDNNELHFFYDAQGKPATVLFNNVAYTYLHNLQGDVAALIDPNGALAVAYSYDAWGEPTGVKGVLADTLGRLNPFRYRGYVYDVETCLYYLESRYYSYTISRFVSADAICCNEYGQESKNQYNYCLNNPVIGLDEDGFSPYLGYYHHQVQQNFKSMHPNVIIEVGFFRVGSWSRKGRADIVNISTGEIWEVKPKMKSYFRNPIRYSSMAIAQLDSYIKGTLIRACVKPNGASEFAFQLGFKPGGVVPQTTITNDPYAFITYYCEGDGIIWYNVIEKLQWPKETAVASNPAIQTNRVNANYAPLSNEFAWGLAVSYLALCGPIFMGSRDMYAYR